MKRTESAGGVVLNSRGEVLVVSQKGDSWSLPKGHIESGEEALAAAQREIYEESGIRDLVLVGVLGSYERARIGPGGQGEDTDEMKRITVFLFKTPEMQLSPKDPDHPEARWMEIESVPVLLTHPKDKEFFISNIDKIERLR